MTPDHASAWRDRASAARGVGDDPTADECEDVAKAYDDCAEYHGDEFERQIIARLRASIRRLDARDV